MSRKKKFWRSINTISYQSTGGEWYVTLCPLEWPRSLLSDHTDTLSVRKVKVIYLYLIYFFSGSKCHTEGSCVRLTIFALVCFVQFYRQNWVDVLLWLFQLIPKTLKEINVWKVSFWVKIVTFSNKIGHEVFGMVAVSHRNAAPGKKRICSTSLYVWNKY